MGLWFCPQGWQIFFWCGAVLGFFSMGTTLVSGTVGFCLAYFGVVFLSSVPRLCPRHTFLLLPQKGISMLYCLGWQSGEQVVQAMQDCPSYTLRCIFPCYYAKTRTCDLSSGFFSSYESVFLWGYLFDLLLLHRNSCQRVSIPPSCSSFSTSVWWYI